MSASIFCRRCGHIECRCRVPALKAELSKLRGRLADRERRIKEARRKLIEAGYHAKPVDGCLECDAAQVLDLRKPMRPARRRR